MADSPNLNSDAPVRLTVSCDGQAKPALEVLSVTVRHSLNRVPWAELVIEDGDMTRGVLPISDEELFKPGAKVAISVGYGEDETEIFSGIVIRHGVKIHGQNSAELVVECRDAACRMTVGRRNANYIDKTDSDIISTLIAAHGLQAEVAATTLSYAELVQFYCNDWDFMLARAELNGLLVNVAGGKVSVQPPDVAADPVLSVSWGVDLMSFEADMDARLQFAEAKATAWNPKTQAIVQGNAAKPEDFNLQGNIPAEQLANVAGPASYGLQSSTSLEMDMLTGWAKALQVKSALARVRGHMSFTGSAKAVPGCLIEVTHVGGRFNGSVFVSGVEHTIADGNWLTEVVFGMGPEWQVEREDVMAPANGGLLPGVGGLQIGVVMKLDGDPKGEQRIQVKLPVMQAQTEGVWARLLQFYASNTFGAFFLPEVGDEVIVGYLNDDPSHPLVLGSLYSSARTPPYTIEAANNTKAVVTRAKHKIEFNEEDKIITITTPANNKVVLDDKDKSILVQDQHNNSAKFSSSGIALDSPYDIKLDAKGGITLTAVKAIEITSQADVKASGLNVSCEAQAGFTGKGSASAELSAAGQTTVRGATVMIN